MTLRRVLRELGPEQPIELIERRRSETAMPIAFNVATLRRYTATIGWGQPQDIRPVIRSAPEPGLNDPGFSAMLGGRARSNPFDEGGLPVAAGRSRRGRPGRHADAGLDGCVGVGRPLYLGAALALIGVYVACAVLILPLPLPQLLADRRTRVFRQQIDAFLVEGHALNARQVRDEFGFSELEVAYAGWEEALGPGCRGTHRRPIRRLLSMRWAGRQTSSVPSLPRTTICA